MDMETVKTSMQATDLDDELLDNALAQITSQPKRQYTRQEIDEARGNLALMNDRVFMVTFCDNKNNFIITGIVNALRKIHALDPIPPIERTTIQNVSLVDVLGRGMIGDLFGEGAFINIAVEVQKEAQKDYAVRGTLTSGNAMRTHFKPGDTFSEAPDVIGINILGFALPELENRKMFCSRIVRAEYESREPFLADKYSDYYIELPKQDDWTKDSLPEEYHDLWDLCCIFRAKTKDLEEVMHMQAITNPTALELLEEVKKTVAPNDFVNETLDRKSEL
ncbi:MAG: Rpn family recombination-promoting nuclease/putative transposase, partial [Gracilibacteraceae bacterium]|nr:Rpn family recombination-promoting nuclease/putative transposase [Gracilibacteraceae bacterium]